MTTLHWILICLGIAQLAGLALVGWMIWKAPLGEETEQGFREIKK